MNIEVRVYTLFKYLTIFHLLSTYLGFFLILLFSQIPLVNDIRIPQK